MTRSRLPKGWTEARVQRVLEHYESQREEEAAAEDEAAFRRAGTTVIAVPTELIPEIDALIARRRKKRRTRAKPTDKIERAAS